MLTGERKKWTIELTPVRVLEDYPIALATLGGQILDSLPADFWRQMGKEFDLDVRFQIETLYEAGHVEKALWNTAESIAHDIPHRIVVEPHWYVMGILAANTYTERWSMRTPTLFEKAQNQMQHGLDNLVIHLANQLYARMDTPMKARALLAGGEHHDEETPEETGASRCA